MPSIADVYTTVLPETSAIAPGIVKALRAVDNDAYQAGKRWGREIQRGMDDVTVNLKVDAAKAKAQIKDAAQDQDATIEVDADTAKAEAQIDVAARDRKSTIEVDVDRANLGNIASSVAGSLASAVGEAAPRLAAEGAKVGSSMGSSMGGAMQPALIAAGVTALAGIASAASGALALIPAGIAGAGSVIGTLVLGLDGVKDAWDAAGKAADSSGKDQAAQAKAVSSAQKSLSSAVKDEERAQKDVANARKQARQQLEDLNLELRGGALDVKQAQLDAQQAREDLVSGQYETATQYEQAQLRVLQADQRVAEAQQRQGQLQADANDQRAKGVEGADQVVAANDRLADAHQRVADAQQGVNDATAQSSSAADSAAQAMAKLSPNAQSFMTTLLGMKPAFEEFKNSIQDALFANLGPQFQQLAGTYLPILQTAFTGLAGTINQSLSGLMSWLGQPETMAAVQQIFANIGSSFQIWSQSLKPVSEAFLTITQVGSGFLPQLADMVVKAANAFNQFIQQAAQSGQLDQWIQTGITALSTFGDILTTVGQMFIDLAPLGQPLLELVKSVLTALEPAMGPLATALGALVTAATPLLTIAAQLVTTLIQGIAPGLTQWWNTMAPVAQTIANALLPVLQDLAPVLADVGITLATQFTDAVKQLAPHIGPLAQQFSELLRQLIPMIPSVFKLVLAMSPLFQAVVPMLTEALIKLLPHITTVIDKISNLAAWVIPPLSAVMETLSQKFEQVWPKISGAIKTAWTIIKPILDLFSGGLRTISGPLGTLAGIVDRVFGGNDNSGPGKSFVPGNRTSTGGAAGAPIRGNTPAAPATSAFSPRVNGSHPYDSAGTWFGNNASSSSTGAGDSTTSNLSAASSSMPSGTSADPVYVQVVNAGGMGTGTSMGLTTTGTSTGAGAAPGGAAMLPTGTGTLPGATENYSPDWMLQHGFQPVFHKSGGDATQQEIPPWVHQLAEQYHLQVNRHADATLEGGTESSGNTIDPTASWAFDFSSASAANMQQFADAIKANPSSIVQEIWQNPNTGAQAGVAGGQVLGKDQYYNTGQGYSSHTDHVHVAFAGPMGQTGSVMPASGMPTANATNYASTGTTAASTAASSSLTASSSQDQIAAAIITQAQQRGFSREQTIAVLSTALQESGLNPAASGGGGAWHGIFQQDTSYPGRDNPATNISEFFNRLGAPTGDIWSQIFALQQGTPYTAGNARTAYMTEIQSKTGPAAALYNRLAGAVTASTSTPTGSAIDPLTVVSADPNISLNSNIPESQRKQPDDKGGASSFEQLGKDIGSGLLEIFGLDGSLFKDPTQFAVTQLFAGLANLKFNKQQPGSDGATSPTTGGGGDFLNGALSMIPQPFGALASGSPQNAPGGAFTPALPAPAPGGFGGSIANKTPAPSAVVNDQRVDLRGSNFGYSPTQVQDQIRSGQMASMRQPARHLPS